MSTKKKPAGSGRAMQTTQPQVYKHHPKKKGKQHQKNDMVAGGDQHGTCGSSKSLQKHTWQEVTQGKPCPVCGKPDWCSRNTVRSVVLCRRNPSKPNKPDWVRTKSKVDKNKQPYGRWRRMVCKEATANNSTESSDDNTAGKVASAKTRNKVYGKLLKELPLTKAAKNELLKRGLDDKDLEQRQYKYLDGRRKTAVQAVINAGLEKHLPGVPGFYRKENGDWSFSGSEGILIPVRDSDGRIIALKIRTNKPLESKYIYASSVKKGGTSPGSPVHVPVHAKGSFSVVRITEGELKADIATVTSGILTLGLPGVVGFAKAEPILKTLAPKKLLIAVDADYRKNAVVAKALIGAIKMFRPKFHVIVETWPSKWGKGIDDVLATGKKPKRRTGKAIDKLIASLKGLTATYSNAGDRPIIEITSEEKTVNDQAVAALGRDKTIFQRGNVLVHVLTDQKKPKGIIRPKGSARITTVPLAVLRERLADAAVWQASDAKGDLKDSHPPKWSVEAIFMRGRWDGIRPLEGIIFGPVLRADGTVSVATGYDTATGLICESFCTIPDIPDKPTAKHIKRALKLLHEAVADFPFESEIHKSAWLAFLLSLLSQYAFPGPAPLYLIDANTPGTGKGLLCDVASIIATGRPMSRMANPTNNDEARKRITAIAISGDPHVLIDNIDGDLGSPALDAALTSETWKDRILGRSEMVELPLKTIWSATGNNVSLEGDLPRRVMRSRLITELEHPEERTKFRHPNLLKWAKQNRGKLLAAALTLLRGYCAAGRPDQGLPAWGSFEGWSDLVRSTVVWAGLPDPAATRQELTHGADPKTQALAALMNGLLAFDPNCVGRTVGEILDQISDCRKESADWIRDAVVQLCPTTNGMLPGPQKIGMMLSHNRKRNVGGRCLEKRERNHTSVWYVQKIGTGTTGATGANSLPTRSKSKKSSNKKNKHIEVGKKSSRSSRSSRSHSADREVF